MRQFQVRAGLLAVVALVASTGTMARAQDAPEQGRGRGQYGGQFAGMQRISGVVTAVSGDNFTVKTETGPVQVVTTTNTRVMKGQGETMKVTEIKAGDGVMAMGNLDSPTKTVHAAMLFVQDAEQMKKLRENLGKTYISGRVTAINSDDLKMTLTRPDGVSQTIGFDETTSFKRGGRARMQMGANGVPTGGSESGESITLADIKVGDNVAATGSVKSGVFVPTQLNLLVPRTPGAGRGPRGAGAAPGGAGAPPATAPQTPPQ